MLKEITILFALVLTSWGQHSNVTLNTNKFPKDFLFGTASSSYQIEGAWNEDGKGESMWDRLTHTRTDKIADGSNGDIACDSYHRLDEDIALLKDLGVQHYRFSLSWPRILPTGFPNKINKAGIDYYNNLINKLLKNNIIPMVTIYHWDLPQSLQQLGGFTNPLIMDWFEAYARIVFEHFGDRIKIWTTFNEPRQICLFGYGLGTMAPGVESPGVGDYICSHYLLKAHARVYHLYDKFFKRKQKGRVGIVIECAWHEPGSDSKEDIEAAERKTQFDCGWYAHPIFSKTGDYPKVMKEFIGKRSKEEGYAKSRLPTFTPTEVKYIRGSSDYFGLNHYMSFIAADKPADPIGNPSHEKDVRAEIWQDPSWPVGAVDIFRSTPWGFRKILKWLKDNYNNPVIYITENGFPDVERFHDTGRIDYHVNYLSNLLDAIYTDGVNVKGYTQWSMLDYFEWYQGYTVGFGLYHVNFTDPTRPRTPRDSLQVYKEILKNRKLSSTDQYDKKIVIIILTITTCGFKIDSNELNRKTFPKDFLFGVGTSSYQIEGAWNLNGKSENIWDHFVHAQSQNIADGTNGDIACDSYHKLKEDIILIKNLGVDYYRFSLSWSRILPTPFNNNINQDGINYYNQLIDLLLKNGIQPMVTLFHWNFPQFLQALGGFTNPIIIEEFVRYAKIAFKHFGDRVKFWTTFNEPNNFCLFGYAYGTSAPAIKASGIGEYLCAHNILKAQARVYHIYNNTFKSTQKGRISITLNSRWYEPASGGDDDTEAANKALQFTLGFYAHPIFTTIGDYPEVMKENIKNRSILEGFSQSRLPTFTKQEIEYIKGTHDYFSLNYYTTFLTANKESDPVGMPSFDKDINVDLFQDPSWPESALSNNKVVPWGFSKLLKWIKGQYGNPEIYIAENGFGDFGEINDIGRINFYSSYLNAVLDFIDNDDVRVKAYTAWSLMDNFEWTSGYTVKFGLYQVNFSNPNRTRTTKASAEYFKQVIATRRP